MRRRLLAAFALLATAAARAPAPPAEFTRTVIVSAVDYPADVVPAAELHARLRFELAANGSVTGCSVVQSSGQPSIDAASCRIIVQRVRIRLDSGATHGTLLFVWLGPASLATRNMAGAPIPFSFVDTVTDNDYPLDAIRRRESGTVEYDVDVSAAGQPLGCTVTRSSGSASLDRRTCELVMTRGAFIPASDGAGGRRRATYHARFTWRF